MKIDIIIIVYDKGGRKKERKRERTAQLISA
jgi:hypothetical protein